MKSDEPSNSNTNRCTLQRSLGKSFTIFIPTSKKDSRKVETNPVVRQLAQQFDYVYTSPVERCSTAKEANRKLGIRAEALRRDHKESSEQDYSDMAFVLKIVHEDLQKPDRVRLLDINKNISIYNLNCHRVREPTDN